MTTSRATRRKTWARWKTGGRSRSKVTGNAMALCRDLVQNLDVAVQSLQQGVPVELDVSRQSLHQPGERGRRLAVDRHVVAVGVVTEELLPGLHDVVGMLEQPIGVHVALPDLALGSVFADEPVVAERLRVLLPRQPHHFGGLLLEADELAFLDPQSSSHLEHGLLLSLDDAVERLTLTDRLLVHTCFGTFPA